MPQKVSFNCGYFLRLVMGNRVGECSSPLLAARPVRRFSGIIPLYGPAHKNNTPLECATTERYRIHERLPENGTTIKRSYTPIIVCTKYVVLRHNYLIKSSHILLLSFHNLPKQIDFT